MKLITFLYELTDVLGKFTDIEEVKLIPSNTGCKIECVSVDKMYVVHATATEAIEDLTEQIGIYNIRMIKNALASPGINRLTSTVTYIHHKQNPRFVLLDDKGNNFDISLYSESMTNENIKVPPLKVAVNYEVSICPNASGIALLMHWSKEMRNSKNSCQITPFTTPENQLNFRYTPMPNHQYNFTFAENVEGTLDAHYRYPDKAIIQALKLFSTSKSFNMQFCRMGLITIEIKTTFITFLFHYAAYKN